MTASCGVKYITLVRLPFKHETCDQYHLLFSQYVHFPNVLIFFCTNKIILVRENSKFAFIL